MSKVIALLPFKNEERFLPTYLSTITKITDQIIAVDDNSTDNSFEIMKNAGAILYSWNKDKMKYGWAELGIRNTLLELGRENKGEYFVILDADETFTYPFIDIHKKVLNQLRPGQKIMMQWLAMWKSVNHYREDNSIWSNNYKDFIFRDDKKSKYPEVWMHTPRTPGRYSNKNEDLVLNPKYGAVMHFQFSDWINFQLKQCWFKMSELIKEPNNVYNINQKYKITLDDNDNVIVNELPEIWGKNILFPNIKQRDIVVWRLNDIENWFKLYGVSFFSKLDIWHVPEIASLAKQYQ